MHEYRVMMIVNGAVVPSSCIKTGTKAQCKASAARLARIHHSDTQFIVLPCIEVPHV